MRISLGQIIEAIAVGVSISFTALLSLQIVWAWLFAALSAILYLYICWSRRLYAESLLQVFYLVMAYVGFRQWQGQSEVLFPEHPWLSHLILIASGAFLSFLGGSLLKAHTAAALPFVDSFTTVFSILATVIMVQADPSHWLYWIAIDATGVYLYYKRGLYLSAGLFVLYTILAINGFLQW